MRTLNITERMTERLSKGIKTSTLLKRWVWSRLCGFPNICEPGTRRSVDYRRLYKRSKEFYGIETYSVKRAAEILGVYAGQRIDNGVDDYYHLNLHLKPYIPGWRVKPDAWASVRNPVWRDNPSFGKGIYKLTNAVRAGDRFWAEDEIKENVIAYNQQFYDASPDMYARENERYKMTLNPYEFLIQRPEIYLRGFSDTSWLHYVRGYLVRELVPRIKCDDDDVSRQDLFYPQEIEDVYNDMNRERVERGLNMILRQHYYRACCLFLISSWKDYKENEVYKKTHGLRPFLDVIDQAKIRVLEAMEKGMWRPVFEVQEVWEAFRCGNNVGEKIIYDSALAELVYEGFLRTKSTEYGVNDKGYKNWLECYAAANGTRDVKLSRLYLHTLNSCNRRFTEYRPVHYAEYRGQDVWDKWA